jgi:hypothetical protein
MKKVTIITNSDHDSILAEFNHKLKDEVNIFERELYNSKTLVFENISYLTTNHITPCEILIIEDDINVVLTYLEILKDAPLINNILATTKPKPTITVINLLSHHDLLKNVSVIFLDFDLAEAPSNHTVNEQNAQSLYDLIDEKFIHGPFPARLIGITAYEGMEDKYASLQKNMRENGDYVLNKRILRDEDSRADFKTILKSIPGIYWKTKTSLDKKIAEVIDIEKFVREYETKNPPPKDIDHAMRLLDNIEIALPEISSKQKFAIAKEAETIIKPNSTENYSSYQTLRDAITGAAPRIIWILKHPANSKKYPKFRHQYNHYSVFKSQIQNGLSTKR